MKDENGIYAEMLEMPVSTCDVIFKPARKKKRDSLKQQVIAKVNYDETPTEEEEKKEKKPLLKALKEKKKGKREKREPQEKRERKFDVIYFEGVAVFLLIATILLTNIFWEGSGINTIMKNVFNEEATVTDARPYRSFSAKSPSDELVSSLNEGVITLSGSGAVYPVCDGTLTSVSSDGETYTLTVSHSDVFKTVISGLNYVYAEEGNEVYKYIPIGYVGDGNVTVSMFNDGLLLTGYILEGGNIVWES